MPLEQRVVQPIHVSRGTLPLNEKTGQLAINIPNELECVTNGTLANIVRQLSTLSKQADDIFSGIMHEATRLMNKTSDLHGRVGRLASKVTSLDSTVEEVSLHDIHLRKPFKSSVVFDQQVVSRDTMSAAMLELYDACDAPPPLSKLNPYREDGKDGLKFYTDPDYFFDLWRQEMLRDTERDVRERSGKKISNRPPGKSPVGPDGKKVKKVRAPANTRERYREIAAAKDIIIGSSSNNNQYGDAMQLFQQQNTLSHDQSAIQARNNSITGSGLQPAPPPPTGVSPAPSLTPGSRGTPSQPLSSQYSGQGTDQQADAVTAAQREYNQSQELLMQMIASASLPGSQDSQQKQTQPAQSYTQYSQHVSTPSPSGYQVGSPPGAYNSGTGSPRRQSASLGVNVQMRPNQAPPPPPGGVSHSPSPVTSGSVTMSGGRPPSAGSGSLGGVTRETLPPPPPPPPTTGGGTPTHHHVTSLSIGGGIQPAVQIQPTLDIPPPPPPPPPASLDMSNSQQPRYVATHQQQPKQHHNPIPQIPTAQQLQAAGSQLRKTSERVMAPAPISDARSDLLAAIREGIKLRRVEDSKQKEVEKCTPLHDVASILARRVAMELSDSDEGGEGDEEDDDPWDENSES